MGAVKQQAQEACRGGEARCSNPPSWLCDRRKSKALVLNVKDFVFAKTTDAEKYPNYRTCRQTCPRREPHPSYFTSVLNLTQIFFTK